MTTTERAAGDWLVAAMNEIDDLDALANLVAAVVRRVRDHESALGAADFECRRLRQLSETLESELAAARRVIADQQAECNRLLEENRKINPEPRP